MRNVAIVSAEPGKSGRRALPGPPRSDEKPVAAVVEPGFSDVRSW
jgi:hypothetical protein